MSLDINKSTDDFRSLESDERGSSTTRGIAILCALGLTAALTMGYLVLRKRHAEKVRAEEQAAAVQEAKPAPAPLLQLFVDDAMIKGSQAVLGGTLLNISGGKLTDLSVELELKRRKDGSSETRMLSIEPRDLDPQEQGRYALTVPSGDYRETRVIHIRSGASPNEIAFKMLPGAQRPPEKPRETKVNIVKPTPKRGKGEEFINTPDTPVKIP
ncbi:MAG: hypothetical protein JOZ52_10685 [Acidobacteria bacterium]|nr:hypothetical protein [Acidobacteriota bacterium]